MCMMGAMVRTRRQRVLGQGLALVGVATVLVSCGAAQLVAGHGCSVPKLWFKLSTTTTQIASVESHVRRDPSTQSVKLTTRKEALAAMRKKFPDLMNSPLPSNPFPASLVVRLKSGVDAAKFVRRYRAMGLAGVADVGLTRPNGSQCFIS
jgi:hypothetical protein